MLLPLEKKGVKFPIGMCFMHIIFRSCLMSNCFSNIECSGAPTRGESAVVTVSGFSLYVFI
jgi:hypothetical protein